MPLPFTELAIHRFRGLRDVVLRDLGSVNIFVGTNNSGKTSVLEALSLAANPFDPFGWVQVATRRDLLGSALRAGFFRLRWLFPHGGTSDPQTAYRGHIELSVGGGSLFQSIRADYQDLRSLREAPPSADAGGAPLPPFVIERNGVRLEVEAVHRAPESARRRETFEWWEGERNLVSTPVFASTPVRLVTPYDHLIQPLLAEQYSDARRRGGTDQIIELLSAIDPRIQGLEVLTAPRSIPREADATLYIRDASAGLLPIDAFGDGIRRILLIAFAIASARNGILLVDELETAIHISALGRAFRWMVQACADNNVQLFATTHSLEAIDALLAADDTPAQEDIVGYRLEASGQVVTARRYGEDLLRRLRTERGLEVR
jgi:hypothetical protein